ncbi:hypothetical protein QFW77_03150 [Luteimonas sp. RD2P54]|uniref:Secreted protein with PEP-CTERM sorting signal n=1 Tax=Luteimonas endophytica TaxID=3042023 RepID=A0ABT6J5B8_9GAMM|nr:hypothetical protein [Luteimonas endophytica]MDH5821991.1 hypothetical protein [Luteimonas endophytica]
MRFLGKAIGCLATALGLGVVIFGAVALADPQGAQLANDSDPFGVPPSTVELLLHVAAGAALSALGVWLVARKPRV